MKKKVKQLPVLTINDENDGSLKTFISKFYVIGVLQSLLIDTYKEPEKVQDRIKGILTELESRSSIKDNIL